MAAALAHEHRDLGELHAGLEGGEVRREEVRVELGAAPGRNAVGVEGLFGRRRRGSVKKSSLEGLGARKTNVK